MRISYIVLTAIIICAVSAEVFSAPMVRVKDIAKIEGERDNQLVGYGLIVGLDRTGDSKNAPFTTEAMMAILENFGISMKDEMAGKANIKSSVSEKFRLEIREKIRTRNIAAVMVTATLPPYRSPGDKIDVNVASIGDASSLEGGILLQTPMKAADGNVYAVAQGPISIGGYNRGTDKIKIVKNHPTAGMITEGAIVEKEVSYTISRNGVLRITLKESDFSTASRLVDEINANYGANTASAKNAGVVDVIIPNQYSQNLVGFISGIESLTITPDAVAKIVVNERTGTIVMGEDIKISEVAVSHGNLKLVVKQEQMAGGFFGPQATQTANVEEKEERVILMKEGAKLKDVVKALNSVGATPRDVISILQLMKSSGALHAELVIR